MQRENKEHSFGGLDRNSFVLVLGNVRFEGGERGGERVVRDERSRKEGARNLIKRVSLIVCLMIGPPHLSIHTRTLSFFFSTRFAAKLCSLATRYFMYFPSTSSVLTVQQCPLVPRLTPAQYTILTHA